MKHIIETSLCLLLLVDAHAQTAALAAIQKICSAYQSGTTISFSSSMKMYAKNNPGKIIEKVQGNYKLRATGFACSIGSLDMLLNDRYYVSVDKTIKLIIIGYKKDLAGTEQIPVLNTEQFKAWINEKKTRAALIPGKVTSILELTDVRGITGYNLYRISYDTRTGYLKKVLLETADQNDPAHKTMVLETDYTRPLMVGNDKKIFSEKQFFSLAGNKIIVTDNYKGYQLINQL